MHLRRSTTAVALAAALAVAGATASSAEPDAGTAPAQAGPRSLSVLGSLDLGGSLGSLAPQGPQTPVLESIKNFRDVAGSGYTGEYGPLNTGVFFRANAPLKTSEADLATLAGLGITRSYDMRAQNEIDNPYVGGQAVLPGQTEYAHVPIDFADIVEMAMQIQSAEEAREHMVNTNRGFVTDAQTRGQFARVLSGLAENGDPQMVHCTSGKDRTGWVGFLLLSIAGIDRETIMEDYLLSNANLEQDNERIIQIISAALSPEAADNLYPLLIVEPGYLQAGIDQLDDDYDDVESYLTDGLGLTEQTIENLRAKLVG
ncbi:tyrosine-protein phosphatase [Dietzia aurantiaca]|uniref:Tyrosine-protein phosphatase n=1 Tax=Dietzia aurantiaca TaxID=983873 RepID=A0ABV9PMX9_9ACTN